MELVVAVGALVFFALLSLRFGVDSTPAAYLPGHPREHRELYTHDAVERPVVPTTHARPEVAIDPLPTLHAIDAARRPAAVPFAAALNAAHLEQRARELTTEYWGESPWLTGHISFAQLHAMCEALEHERQTEIGPDSVTVMIAREPLGRSAVARM